MKRWYLETLKNYYFFKHAFAMIIKRDVLNIKTYSKSIKILSFMLLMIDHSKVCTNAQVNHCICRNTPINVIIIAIKITAVIEFMLIGINIAL